MTSARIKRIAFGPLCLLSLIGAVALAGENHHRVKSPNGPDKAANAEGQRPKYEINLALDFDKRTFSGSERVRWTNRSEHSISTLYFHLYANVHSEEQSESANVGDPSSAADEPGIEVIEVRSATTDAPLPFSVDDQTTSLRVSLRQSVAPGTAVEVAIKFKGSVPEIDPDETGLVTHVIKQVSAAIKGEREIRLAREINFRSRGVMLLGTPFPILAVHDGEDWIRKVEPSVGDLVFAQASDYEVTVAAPPDIVLFSSAPEIAKPEVNKQSGKESHAFGATGLRDFAIVAGKGLHVETRAVEDVTVRSIFLPEHERVGQRVLAIASGAVRIYRERFGPLPFKTVTVAEAPLVAGLGSTAFAGLDVMASAFYVDFESAAVRNMPELIREQRASVEDSLEWTIAHLVANQWWSAAVGNDPAREPALDESLASWSALFYYQEIYGEARSKVAEQDQLRGVYRLYRTFGGEDLVADHSSHDYRNSFQYAAIVMTKGALMFAELRRQLGNDRFFAALRSYYQANLLEIADLEDLHGAFIAEAPIEQRRMVARTFNRWLSSKRGDEDIAPPDGQLAASLGLPTKPETQRSGDKNAFNMFGKLGKFFWQQMTRIH
jgi:Peptidase family M1 domain